MFSPDRSFHALKTSHLPCPGRSVKSTWFERFTLWIKRTSSGGVRLLAPQASTSQPKEAPVKLSTHLRLLPTMPPFDSPKTTDEALMLAYQAGDIQAFDELYERHKNKLFGFLMRGLGRRAQAEDCFQEVWRRMIQSRERYQPQAKFSTWLYQIANNLLTDQYRRHAPEQAAMQQMANEPKPENRMSSDPLEGVSDFERRRRVQLAMEQLPDEQRVALQLRLEHEYSLEQIAEITGASRETVKSRLRYAQAKLIEELGS